MEKKKSRFQDNVLFNTNNATYNLILAKQSYLNGPLGLIWPGFGLYIF